MVVKMELKQYYAKRLQNILEQSQIDWLEFYRIKALAFAEFLELYENGKISKKEYLKNTNYILSIFFK